MTYNAGNQLVTSLQGAMPETCTYDDNGNMTVQNVGSAPVQYAYDPENRLTKFTNAAGEPSSYTYAGDGLRRSDRRHDTHDLGWAELPAGESVMPTVSYTVIKRMIVHENRAGIQHDYLADSLGSTYAVVDDTGTTTDTFAYWPYGAGLEQRPPLGHGGLTLYDG